MSHFHLDPRDVGFPKMQPLVVWSRDLKTRQKSIDFILSEFDEYISIINLEDLVETLLDLNDFEFIEKELEKYNFHVIKVNSDSLELIMHNNERYFIEEINEFEADLESLVRKLIAFSLQDRG